MPWVLPTSVNIAPLRVCPCARGRANRLSSPVRAVVRTKCVPINWARAHTNAPINVRIRRMKFAPGPSARFRPDSTVGGSQDTWPTISMNRIRFACFSLFPTVQASLIRLCGGWKGQHTNPQSGLLWSYVSVCLIVSIYHPMFEVKLNSSVSFNLKKKVVIVFKKKYLNCTATNAHESC